jgi:hypothetical protein
MAGQFQPELLFIGRKLFPAAKAFEKLAPLLFGATG